MFQGSSSMLAGSVMGVPGPVATTRPPWTWRLSTAVGGRYRPTLVRSSPSSGAMSTRSPTTIRRLGDSSAMDSSIHPRAPAGLAHGSIPFRLGHSGGLLTALVMSWWDAARMCWFYWVGMARFLLVLVGSIWGLLRLGAGLIWGTLKSVVMSPFTLLHSTSRQPGVPWIAFTLLIFWSMIEATIFTFTLRPTMSELLSDLTGYQVNPLALVVLLWFFLVFIIGGSFACIQVLNEAIKTRSFGQIGAMVGVEITVALFEVLFLYRELIDAITPWLAQQGIELGVVGTLGLAFLGWTGVRGMTWFLFGRFGTPALLAILGRQAR